ncbi:Transposase [Lactiplantibacillus plantarum]|nr:Transposase [Lactiplantibacillus plantarum]
MGRKGSRYTIKEKLFYIGLVTQGMAPNAVQRKYGVEHSQVSRWVKRYGLQGIDGECQESCVNEMPSYI